MGSDMNVHTSFSSRQEASANKLALHSYLLAQAVLIYWIHFFGTEYVVVIYAFQTILPLSYGGLKRAFIASNSNTKTLM